MKTLKRAWWDGKKGGRGKGKEGRRGDKLDEGAADTSSLLPSVSMV